jgi:hypothetical protein
MNSRTTDSLRHGHRERSSPVLGPCLRGLCANMHINAAANRFLHYQYRKPYTLKGATV